MNGELIVRKKARDVENFFVSQILHIICQTTKKFHVNNKYDCGARLKKKAASTLCGYLSSFKKGFL